MYRDILQIHHHTGRRSHIYICHYSLLHNDHTHMLQQKTLLINWIYFYDPYRESTCMHQDLSPRFFRRLNHLRNFRESRLFHIQETWTLTLRIKTYSPTWIIYTKICWLGVVSHCKKRAKLLYRYSFLQLQTNESYDTNSFYLIVTPLPIYSWPSTFPLDCKVTFEDLL